MNNSSYGMLTESTVYVDRVRGDDSMAEADNRSRPFRTMDAAMAFLDERGDDFRIRFLSPGEYTWTMRVMVGAVLHLFADDPSLDGAVTVTLDNGAPNGGVFFYDTHINLTGTERSPMRLRAPQYIEVEGGTLWTVGSVKLDCSYLYLIDGSGMLRNLELERGYVLGRFGNCAVENLVVRNVEPHAAFDWMSGVVRVQGEGLRVAVNPNGSKFPAVVLKSCVANLNAKSGGYPNAATKTGYSKYLDVYCGTIQIADSVVAAMDKLGVSKCSIGGIRVSGNTVVR